MELNIGAVSRGINQARVDFVGLLNPLFGCSLVTAETHVTANKPLPAQIRIDVDIPDFVEQRPHSFPVAVLEQKIVAFGDDKRHIGRDRNCAGDGLFDLPAKSRGVDCFVITLLAQATQQCDITRAVECIFGTFTGCATETCEFRRSQDETRPSGQPRLFQETHRELPAPGLICRLPAHQPVREYGAVRQR